jgi:hypothetical protein
MAETVTIDVQKIRDIFMHLHEDDQFAELFDALGFKPKGPSTPLRNPELLEIPVGKVTAILNAIDTFGVSTVTFKENHITEMQEYSNTQKYFNASFFKDQVAFTVYKLIQQVTSDHPKIMKFEEVKRLINDLFLRNRLADRIAILIHYRANVMNPPKPEPEP